MRSGSRHVPVLPELGVCLVVLFAGLGPCRIWGVQCWSSGLLQQGVVGLQCCKHQRHIGLKHRLTLA